MTALDAMLAVIALHTAQVQPLGQVVGVGSVDAQAHESAYAGRKNRAGGVIPGFGKERQRRSA
ncbi:hypothetical protein LJR130_003041 [Variovorax sp. LjRoot130]|uniref:hypothetical protein n=1 Tax=Variovorax sp. LjRoot130 TaxID=3342261 RepID=UPI003ECC5DE2